MKKLIVGVLLAMSSVAWAHSPYHNGWHYRHHHHGNYNWVIPAVIGGAVVYGMTRPAETVIVQPQPQVIVTPQNGCTAWREIQQPDGTIIRERTCYGVQ